MAEGVAPHWQNALALDRRSAPEFYTSVADIGPGPHADAIRFALIDLGLSAVFCIEGVPTIGFVNQPDVSLTSIDELHRMRDLVIAGKPGAPDTLALLEVVRDHPRPHQVVLLADGAEGPLPIGVQIIGQRWREDMVVDAMQAIEAEIPPLCTTLWKRMEQQSG